MTFETHTKTAEPIEMPFGIMSGLGLGLNCFRETVGVTDDLHREEAVFGENMCPISLTPL